MSTCVLISAGERAGDEPTRDSTRQGLTYFQGVSAESAGARGLCLHLITLPPGGRSRPHLHEGHETALYVLSGTVQHWYGEGLREHMVVRAGDFLFIPPGVPHAPVNVSQTEPCVAVLARTDPRAQESVVARPDLDAALEAAVAGPSAEPPGSADGPGGTTSIRGSS